MPKAKHKPLKADLNKATSTGICMQLPREGQYPCPSTEIIVTDRGASFTQAGLGSKADTAEQGCDVSPKYRGTQAQMYPSVNQQKYSTSPPAKVDMEQKGFQTLWFSPDLQLPRNLMRKYLLVPMHCRMQSPELDLHFVQKVERVKNYLQTNAPKFSLDSLILNLPRKLYLFTEKN